MGEGEPTGKIRKKQSTIPELEEEVQNLTIRVRNGEEGLGYEIDLLQRYLNKRRAQQRKLAEQGKSGTVTTLKPKSKK